MQATYRDLWSDPRHEPIDPLSADAARVLDRRGESYAVVLSAAGDPDVIIEVSWKKSHLGVWFADDEGRRTLYYSFVKVDDEWLFLAEITSWTYPDSAVFLFEASVVETIAFRQDGSVTHTIDDPAADRINVFEYADIPVDMNWEPVPAFGCWTSVARRDRRMAARP